MDNFHEDLHAFLFLCTEYAVRYRPIRCLKLLGKKYRGKDENKGKPVPVSATKALKGSCDIGTQAPKILTTGKDLRYHFEQEMGWIQGRLGRFRFKNMSRPCQDTKV